MYNCNMCVFNNAQRIKNKLYAYQMLLRCELATMSWKNCYIVLCEIIGIYDNVGIWI